MLAVNLVWIYSDMVGFSDSLTFCNSKENSVNSQSSIDLFRYGSIHLPTAIAKEESAADLM